MLNLINLKYLQTWAQKTVISRPFIEVIRIHHKNPTVLCRVRSAVWLPRFQYISWMFSGITINMGQHIIPNSTEFGAYKKSIHCLRKKPPKNELHETITNWQEKYHLYTTYMGVSWKGGTQQLLVFLLKITILGCFGGTTILGNTHILPIGWLLNLPIPPIVRGSQVSLHWRPQLLTWTSMKECWAASNDALITLEVRAPQRTPAGVCFIHFQKIPMNIYFPYKYWNIYGWNKIPQVGWDITNMYVYIYTHTHFPCIWNDRFEKKTQ